MDRKPFFAIATKYISENSKILDIGAGDGRFADFVGREDIYLLDGNEQSVAALRKKYKHAAHCRIPDTFPYENEMFDVIHCSHLIEHLQYPDAYALIKEIDRVLKPGGVMVISAPLMHRGFYNNFSHIRPYYPAVLLKYLTPWTTDCATAKMISSTYEKKELIYRYSFTQGIPITGITEKDTWLNKVFFFWYLFKQKIGYGIYERSGFTLVLEKHQ